MQSDRDPSKFYVEAIVGVGNQASNKLAAKFYLILLSRGTDSLLRKPIDQYMKLFKTKNNYHSGADFCAFSGLQFTCHALLCT